VRLNDKTLIDDWLFIDYHDRINVLVEDPENNNTNEGPTQFLIFRQTKYALEGRQSLAIVGGIIEPQEEAQHAAAREVKEELGLNCQMQLLGRFRTDVNRGMGWVNSFIAHDCEKESLQDESKIDPNEEVGAADSEKQKVISMTLQEVVQRVRNGEFVEVQWSNTVALAMMNKRYN
jgi:ADP-ribose pyrophosphatase YjhB (NUDIX family)